MAYSAESHFLPHQVDGASVIYLGYTFLGTHDMYDDTLGKVLLVNLGSGHPGGCYVTYIHCPNIAADNLHPYEYQAQYW